VIDPHWQVVDLDPVTWRNLGPFLEPGNYIRTAQPNEKGLFVLHDDGKVLKVLDTQAGERQDLDIARVDDPHTLAHTLYESGEWDRVHVINKRHLATVARQAQQIENRALTLDAYYQLVYRLIWQSSMGYVSVPPHTGEWDGFTYSQVREFLQHLPDPASVALGVIERGRVVIGLILEIHGGMIRYVTTFEALRLDAPLELDAESFERLWDTLDAQFAPPAAVLLCDRQTFDGLIHAEDKIAYLNAVGHAQPFYYRLQLS